MVTYAQLQKVGFLVDDEEENNSNAATSPHTPASTMAAARDEQMESARQKMYTQIGICSRTFVNLTTKTWFYAEQCKFERF